jgi:hypothetical protein
VGFDFAGAFGRPVKMINDAAMQAQGSYQRGRMLYLGLGTNFGSALVADRVIVPLELGALPYRGSKAMNDVLSKDGRRKLGAARWQKAVDYVLLGGGNAKRPKELPRGARPGGNANAFLGGFRLWNLALPTVTAPNVPRPRRRGRPDWRVL